VLRNNIRIIGSAYAAPVHYYQAVRIAQRYHRELPLAEVVTSRFGLGGVIQAFEAIQRGKAGKAVLMPDISAEAAI
jgi:Zn-dependent alcohol dehydrogenase